MVKQQRFADMEEEEKRVARSGVLKFAKHVCAVESGSGKGILKMRDAKGCQRKLYTHQVIAANRLLVRGGKSHWNQRKASLLAIHEVGSGKTVTAILTMASLRVLNPYRDETKTLIICPLSVLDVWQDTVNSWTTLGNLVLASPKQTLLTEEAVANASVIITTPEVLVAAFKTFAYIGKEAEDVKKPRMKRFRHGVSPTDTDRLAKLNGSLPPVHPLFALLSNKVPQFCLTVVDEIHRVSNPLTLAGHVVGMFTSASTYKLGLTGTPVTSKPSQIANLARILDARPEWLQKPRHFFVPKGRSDRSLRRTSVAAFHEMLVDRVDASFIDLPSRKCLLLEYDPFVGVGSDGSTDSEAIECHNDALSSAQKLSGVIPSSSSNAPSGQWGEEQRAAFSAIVTLGNFEFSSLLGKRGAAEFNKNPSLYEEASTNPSQTMKLILRVIVSRQAAGHCRIAVFCESTTQLRILMRFLEDKRVGDLFLFDGSLSSKGRGCMVKDFLECDTGVLLLSSAGSVGITLCPGCEVLLSVGSLPWNSSTVDQAFGRIYRIGQTEPVEIIQFAAKRSVTFAKLGLHADKRDRLARAATDEDFSNFECGDDAWRKTLKILGACVPLDKCGNYMVSEENLQKLLAHSRLVEMCDANGMRRPVPPTDLPEAPKLAHAVVLPPVSFCVTPPTNSRLLPST